jgi:hypothetical protein
MPVSPLRVLAIGAASLLAGCSSLAQTLMPLATRPPQDLRKVNSFFMTKQSFAFGSTYEQFPQKINASGYRFSVPADWAPPPGTPTSPDSGAMGYIVAYQATAYGPRIQVMRSPRARYSTITPSTPLVATSLLSRPATRVTLLHNDSDTYVGFRYESGEAYSPMRDIIVLKEIGDSLIEFQVSSYTDQDFDPADLAKTFQ